MCTGNRAFEWKIAHGRHGKDAWFLAWKCSKTAQPLPWATQQVCPAAHARPPRPLPAICAHNHGAGSPKQGGHREAPVGASARSAAKKQLPWQAEPPISWPEGGFSPFLVLIARPDQGHPEPSFLYMGAHGPRPQRPNRKCILAKQFSRCLSQQ